MATKKSATKTTKTTKTMRITVKNHNQEFVNRIAEEMGCDAAEAVNYLLIELRKSGYSFNNPTSTRYEAPSQVKDYSDVCQDPKCFEVSLSAPVEALDPVIERFLNLGLDEF